MSRNLALLLFLGAALTLAACEQTVFTTSLQPPANLVYSLEASGDATAPSGILLRWDPVEGPDLAAYRVYSRGATSEAYRLRGTTTSSSFHDAGVPHLQYYVTAEDVHGGESGPSNAVTVDERLRLDAPATLGSTSLNGAIHLEWADNAFRASPTGFSHYRVYSSSYDLDRNLCGARWLLEGTTVSASFLVASLPNGIPRCFGVSAVSVEGFESLWSPLRNDTPRPDARNVILFALSKDADRSGFRFFLDLNGDGQAGPLELGIVGPGTRPDLDFYLSRNATTGQLFLVPQRAGTMVTVYGSGPIADLTSIDVAPAGGYARDAVEALPMWGYVFLMSGGDQFARYGGLRVTAVGLDYIIFDWSYQTDPGNPELVAIGR